MQQVNINRLFIDLILLGNLSWINYAFSSGGIVTDGTVGRAHSFSTPNSDANVTIKQSDGKAVGTNLFHSFSQFNVNTSQTVEFTENIPNTFDNVIARVTGSSRSDIDGTLKSTIDGHADFYLINPNGVVFGQNATINVPSAFHVSTADLLKFKDGSAFNANLKNTSTLTAAAPTAFGFLGTSTANNGLIQMKAKDLNKSFKDGQTLDFVAGKISFTQAGGMLHATEGGEIRLVAKTDRGFVSVERDQFGNLPLPKDQPTSRNAGDITISGTPGQLFELDVSAINVDKGGRIALWGGTTTITDAKLRSDFQGLVSHQTRQNNLEIDANTLTISGSAVSSDIVDSAALAKLLIKTTGDMSIVNNSQISASTYGKGKAGLVVIIVDGNLLLRGKDDSKGVLNGVFSNSEISETLAQGDAGKINISVGKHLDILNGAQISSDSRSGLGRAGDVKVTADGGITIDAVRLEKSLTGGDCPSCLGPEHFTGISSDVVGETAVADGGTVVVASKGNIELRNAGWISSLNAGRGSAGNLNISFGDLLALENFASFRTDSHKFGDGGNISIRGNGFIILKDSFIKTSAVGSGGNIQIKADSLVMETGLVQANAENGSGGRINLDIQALIPSGNTVNGQNIISGDFLQKGQSLTWDTGEFANNIIRSFSQNGVNGSINLAAPQLNLSGSLANLGAPQFDTHFLSQDYCSLGSGSSLRRSGKGGLLPKGRDAWVY